MNPTLGKRAHSDAPPTGPIDGSANKSRERKPPTHGYHKKNAVVVVVTALITCPAIDVEFKFICCCVRKNFKLNSDSLKNITFEEISSSLDGQK